MMEEELEVLTVFEAPAKLYSCSEKMVEWKKLGVGVLILTNNELLKQFRIKMTRGKDGAVTCCHLIRKDIGIKTPRYGNDYLMWSGQKSVGCEEKGKTYLCKFKSEADAELLKKLVEEAIEPKEAIVADGGGGDGEEVALAIDPVEDTKMHTEETALGDITEGNRRSVDPEKQDVNRGIVRVRPLCLTMGEPAPAEYGCCKCIIA